MKKLSKRRKDEEVENSNEKMPILECRFIRVRRFVKKKIKNGKLGIQLESL